jgi:DNA modification methylase
MAKALAHRTIVEDSTRSNVASADYLIPFRKKGDNPVPVTHPTGLHRYAGSREMPADLMEYKGFTGKQTGNKFSHWIWRNYASCFWDDIRLSRLLPYKEGRDKDDERHVHPLQLDVIERACVLWSNPGENVLTPFMGVGSEVYGAVVNGRRGVGVELKPSYYRQAVRNLADAVSDSVADEQLNLMESAND